MEGENRKRIEKRKQSEGEEAEAGARGPGGQEAGLKRSASASAAEMVRERGVDVMGVTIDVLGVAADVMGVTVDVTGGGDGARALCGCYGRHC
eukprot:2085461-Pyramimonas_sp.AAC.1